jgi:hypothetical protein
MSLDFCTKAVVSVQTYTNTHTHTHMLKKSALKIAFKMHSKNERTWVNKSAYNNKIKIQVIPTLGWCSHRMKMRKTAQKLHSWPSSLSGREHGHCPTGLWVVQTTLLNCLAAHICMKTRHTESSHICIENMTCQSLFY